MKIKNEDLLKLKVGIKTRDNLAFQEIAILLDKPEFLQMLPDLRKTYHVEKLVGLDDYFGGTDYYSPGGDLQVEINLKKYKRLKKFKKQFPDQFALMKGKIISDPTGMLVLECNLLCFEFNRPLFFSEVVSQAIFCGTVDNTFYKPTEATVLDLEEFGSSEISLPQAAILVSPASRYVDVKKAFKEADKLIKTDKRLSYYQPKADTVNNIRKYRAWYFERLKGKKHQEIADDWCDKHEEDVTTYIDIIKGVKAYKKLLAR